jgi:integrase
MGKNKDISKIDQDHIESYLQNLEDQGYQPATVLLHLRSLRAFFNSLIRKRAIKWNPTALVNRSARRKKKPVLKLHQVEGLRTHIHAHYRPILEYFLYTGVRPSEVADLKWHHVDMENEVIHQPCRKVREPRDIHMTPPLRRLFQSLRNDRDTDDYVFTGVRGEKIQYSMLRGVFHEAAEKAGVLHQVPSFSLRTFRDTYVSRLAAKYPAFVVQQIMHHSSVTISEQYVGRLTDETKRAAESIKWGDEEGEGRVLEI